MDPMRKDPENDRLFRIGLLWDPLQHWTVFKRPHGDERSLHPSQTPSASANGAHKWCAVRVLGQDYSGSPGVKNGSKISFPKNSLGTPGGWANPFVDHDCPICGLFVNL